MKYPEVTVEKEIKNITLYNGMVITIWLSNGKEDFPTELRVTPDGKPEIYCDDLKIIPFKEWYKIEENPEIIKTEK